MKVKRVASGETNSSAKKPKTPPPKSTKKNKAMQMKIDSQKPKKPPTAFFYFLEHFRKDYQQQNPEVKSMRDVGKACGEKWKTMAYEEKVQYYDIAAEKRGEFDRVMAEYMKRKETGKGDEAYTDYDSELDDDGRNTNKPQGM